jgi:hypothetical protein
MDPTAYLDPAAVFGWFASALLVGVALAIFAVALASAIGRR